MSTGSVEDVTTFDGEHIQAGDTPHNDGLAASNEHLSKTDKPKPHICQMCTRGFARLEHLKRHERSHTKEKPFACNVCSRCFSRRDLLLRHSQKLHQTDAPPSRARGARRESTSAGSGRPRQNSIMGGHHGMGRTLATGMRPRANTISHVDAAAGSNYTVTQPSIRPQGYTAHSYHPDMSSFAGVDHTSFRPVIGFGQHANIHSLPRLATQGLNVDVGGGLRTAPIPRSTQQYDADRFFSQSASTINPAQLHFGEQAATHSTPFSAMPNLEASIGNESMDIDWTSVGNAVFHNGMDAGFENAIEGSSPSEISTVSHFSEVIGEIPNGLPSGTVPSWHDSTIAPAADVSTEGFGRVAAAVMPELFGHNSMAGNFDMHSQSPVDSMMMQAATSAAPYSLHDATASAPDSSQVQMLNNIPMHFHPEELHHHASPLHGMSGSTMNSPTNYMTNSPISEETRQRLLYSLSQPARFGQGSRQPSLSSMASTSSPGHSNQMVTSPTSLPSTANLQRYVDAYLRCFHPHMPFLHVPTLTFDSPVSSSHSRPGLSFRHGPVGGGGCLMLSMAAIGASYEHEHAIGKQLFEAAKQLIHLYLDERRTFGGRTNNRSSATGQSAQHRTPLWLVQAMLLNLIYGHQCGDKVAADIATTHCAALVSLAKAAELDKPDPDVEAEIQSLVARQSASLNAVAENLDDTSASRQRIQEASRDNDALFAEWMRWKSAEERRRTLYSVFQLSSLFTIFYNHPPRILNSELYCNLPCEEDAWHADSPHAWATLGGNAAVATFADALAYLLQASDRRHVNAPAGDSENGQFSPSTLGCYVLINALHVYIWESTQRLQEMQIKDQEDNQLQAFLAPALQAWQMAWTANPRNQLEQSDTYSPLPRDCIPLLDLAYVRLFVNLSKSKEALWARDFEVMADVFREFTTGHEPGGFMRGDDDDQGPSRGTEVQAPRSVPANVTSASEPGVDSAFPSIQQSRPTSTHTTKQVRQLRRAAFYAADSLAMAENFGFTHAAPSSYSLPIQAALCQFDCTQVLAECVGTIEAQLLAAQYRADLDRGDSDAQVNLLEALEEEDVKLMLKVEHILNGAIMEGTLAGPNGPTNQEANNFDLAVGQLSLDEVGFAPRLLMMTAARLANATVWPLTTVMSDALRVHAAALSRRLRAIRS